MVFEFYGGGECFKALGPQNQSVLTFSKSAKLNRLVELNLTSIKLKHGLLMWNHRESDSVRSTETFRILLWL